MRNAIAGASALIGQPLLARLYANGHETILFVRPGAKATARPAISWDPSRGTLSEGDMATVGQIDAVVNLSGAGIGDKRWNTKRKIDILNSRITSTNLLVSHLGSFQGSTPHLINASAIGFYGSRGDELLTEESAQGQGFLAEVCAQWETAAAQATTPVTFVRTGIVLTKRGGALAKQLPLFKLGLGGRLGLGNQWLSPISLDDEVRALLHILEQGLTGPINLVAPSAVTNGEFTTVLAQILHRPAVLTAPAFALKIALGNEMASELLLSSQRISPVRLLESGFRFNHTELRPLLEWAIRN